MGAFPPPASCITRVAVFNALSVCLSVSLLSVVLISDGDLKCFVNILDNWLNWIRIPHEEPTKKIHKLFHSDGYLFHPSMLALK